MSFFGKVFGSYSMPVLMATHGEFEALTITISVNGNEVTLLDNHDCVIFPEEEVDAFDDGGLYTKEMTCTIDVPVDKNIVWNLFLVVLLAEDPDTVLLAEDGSVLLAEGTEVVVPDDPPTTVMTLDETGTWVTVGLDAAQEYVDRRLTNAKVTLNTSDRGNGVWHVMRVLSHSENVWRLQLQRKPPKGMSRSGFRVGE